MNYSSIKDFVNQALHNPCTTSSRVINGVIILLIILSIAVIPLHFLPGIEWANEPLLLFDKVVLTIFTTEYALRIWSAKKPIGYLTSWWGIIDLVAILPFYLSRFDLFAAPEVFLILRILRLLKLSRAYDMERLAISNCETSSHGEFRVIEGERIERVVQKHPLVLLSALIMPLIFSSAALCLIAFFEANMYAIGGALLFIFFAIIFFIKAWLDYNYDVVYITNKRIILQNRELFGAISNDVNYEAITNVVPNNTGILHWLFGYGNLNIETASSAGVLLFKDAPHPHEIVRHISSNRQKISQAKMRNPENSAPDNADDAAEN